MHCGGGGSDQDHEAQLVAVRGEGSSASQVCAALLTAGFAIETNAKLPLETDALVICCPGGSSELAPPRGRYGPCVVVGHGAPCWSCDKALELFADAWVPEQLVQVQLARSLRGLFRIATTHAATHHRIAFDARRAIVWIGTRRYALRRTEFDLMAYLASRRGAWTSQQVILKEAFGAARAYDTALVRVHVHSLRRALGEMGGCIENRRGLGYRLALTG